MVQKIKDKYGGADNFLKLFNPSKQAEFSIQKERCFTGTAPTIKMLRMAYNRMVCESWIECQLKDLSEYAGCRDKLSSFQIEQIAEVIMIEFAEVKVTELMFFFQRFKAGAYGKFYGSVDGLVITEALQVFREEKNKYLRELSILRERECKERKELEREKWRENNKYLLMSKDEFEEIKWLFKM